MAASTHDLSCEGAAFDAARTLPDRDAGRVRTHRGQRHGEYRFGKYEVERELGRGGMGVVLKARDRDLGRPVALKTILSCHLASADEIGRFQDEAKAAAALHHPNIVTVYDAGELHGQPYLAMQLVDGVSLAERLGRGPLPSEDAARIVEAIARAVAHLHEHGIVHRDLKPSNILLDRNDKPYVTDFGLVKMLTSDSRRTRPGVVFGSPSYMSPEQASGRAAQVGPLSDVYGLGAILYEVLTGRPPFLGATPLETLRQVLEGEPIPPGRIRSGVSPELEMICLRCLEKSPRERYATAAAVARDLQSVLKNEPLELRMGGGRARLRRWARREPALAARLVTLAICLGVVQAGTLVHTVPQPLHLTVVAFLVAWAALSVLLQRLLRSEHWAESVRFVWCAVDVVLFSAIVYRDHALLSPVLVVYPALVAASGLWCRERVVWFTAIIAALSYTALLVDWGTSHDVLVSLHKHVMFIVALGALAYVVVYQIRRERALSRYYDSARSL